MRSIIKGVTRAYSAMPQAWCRCTAMHTAIKLSRGDPLGLV